MAGVVLETLSNRKIITLGVVILILQIVFFLIGGLIAPAPSNVQSITGTLCLDLLDRPKDAWFYPRGDGNCKKAHSVDDPIIQKEKITANQVVFSFQFPLPRENMELDMSRWFQHILAVLHLEIDYNKDSAMEDEATLTMDVRLGYRDKNQENWTEIVRSTEQRTLECEVERFEEGYPLKCDLLPFFELGSCHYDYYLVNIRVPVHEQAGMNIGIGSLRDINLVAIHQNGGFTKVWFSIKTTVFPLLLAILSWYWWRISQLERPANLLERTLFALGIVLSIMNVPLEWLTLRFYMPWMLLLGDVRQGLFYAMLLSFWIIFTGEHMMMLHDVVHFKKVKKSPPSTAWSTLRYGSIWLDYIVLPRFEDQIERNRLVMYWKHLSAVSFGCICLFVFEMCERGVQLTNPFYSIWVTKTGNDLALGFIILAGISACLYFIFLSYMIFRVFRNISAKRSALPSMNKARRKYYTGLIYRFKFLMLVTLLASACTVIFFIISQVSEGHWKWSDEDNTLEYSSAFFTGVYGMWNLYVGGLLILYAPSHKHMAVLETTDESNEEEVEFTNIPSEASVLTAFAKKAAAD